MIWDELRKSVPAFRHPNIQVVKAPFFGTVEGPDFGWIYWTTEAHE